MQSQFFKFSHEEQKEQQQSGVTVLGTHYSLIGTDKPILCKLEIIRTNPNCFLLTYYSGEMLFIKFHSSTQVGMAVTLHNNSDALNTFNFLKLKAEEFKIEYNFKEETCSKTFKCLTQPEIIEQLFPVLSQTMLKDKYCSHNHTAKTIYDVLLSAYNETKLNANQQSSSLISR